MIILFFRFGQEFFRLGLSIRFSELEFSVKSLRSSAVVGGRLLPPSLCRIRSAPCQDRVPGLSETSEKCAICFVFWAVYARAILGSWHMQRLNKKNMWENIYFQVGIISKLASYFVPTTLFSWPHLEAFGLLLYDCCVVAFRYRISRLNTFVRAFVVFEGGRSLPNDIITPSVHADSSS